MEKCTDRPTVAAPKCQPSEDEPPTIKPIKNKFFINGIRGDLFRSQRAIIRKCPIHKCVNELSIELI